MSTSEPRGTIAASSEAMIVSPMEPEVAAECILAAVETDRLDALTHGDFEDNVRHRAEGILAALDDRDWYDNHVGTTGHE